jgi:hypothetical protein
MRPLVEVIDMAIKKELERSEWCGSLDPDESDCYPLLLFFIQGCLKVSSTRAEKKKEEKRFEAGLRESKERGVELHVLLWSLSLGSVTPSGAEKSVDTCCPWCPWQGGQAEVPADRNASQPIKEQRAWHWSGLRRCCSGTCHADSRRSSWWAGQNGRRWSLVELVSA